MKRPDLELVGGGGGGGGRERGLGRRGCGGYLGVIVVRVCEPVFQNLPHSYTWPLKKWTHSYTRSSEMLTYSYILSFDFCTDLLLVVRQISHSIH